jgi:hypothetical protein
VLIFKKSKVRLSILVCERTPQEAKVKAEKWAEMNAEDNKEALSKLIGYDAVMVKPPRVQVLKTSYSAVI